MIRKTKQFHRLSTKFICGTTAILVLILAATLFINSRVAGRYYLHRQTGYVEQAGSRLKEYLDAGIPPDEAASALESAENVLVAYAPNTSDYDELSASLRDKFRQKGLGFQKFWLWDQDYISAVQKGFQFRLYQQEKLNYSILVEYIPAGPNLYAVAAIVPNTADFTGIINRFSILLYSVSLAVAVIFLYALAKHITNPLRRMEHFSQAIARQEYGSLTVTTRDELELVADSMNRMSLSIQQYQNALQAKNRQMEQLLNSVTHDLKTPISLIGMYASGIKDGLDDGTFLDTIIGQNARMSQMTERLLNLAGIQQKEYPQTRIRLDRLLAACIKEQAPFLSQRGIAVKESFASNLEVTGNEELIAELFSNLLSNAAKYASDSPIQAELFESSGRCCFRISNESGNENLDTERIWEPFYVGEPSRNKALSGTGLGLAIVKKIAEQCGYTVRCTMEGHIVTFEVIF